MRDDRDDHVQPFVVWLSGFSRETDVVKWLGNLMKLPLAEIDESLTAQSPRLKRRIFERGTSLFPGARRWRNTIRVTDDEYYQVIVSGSGSS